MSSPTTFPRYVNLPTELKLNIVQEAAEYLRQKSYKKSQSAASPHDNHLGQYACIDRVWQDVIERANFRCVTINPSQIMEFRDICGKRYGILHKIRFTMCADGIALICGRNLLNLRAADAKATLNETLYRALRALFDVMKDWSTTERRLPNLINLELRLSDFYFPSRQPIHYDFSGLPTVSVIGNVYSHCFPHFHPSSTISIYKKLPNLEVVYLQLDVQRTVPSTNHETRNAISSLRELSSTPSKITLIGHHTDTHYWGRTNVREELPILQCLVSPRSRWSNTITKLRLPSLNNVSDFLEEAQKTLWPHLRILELGGLFDASRAGSRKATGCIVVQALIGMLSKMPSIMTVNIDVNPMVGWKEMKVDLYLGPDPASEGLNTRAGERIPFEPDKENGIANLGRVSVPGYLLVWLKDAVWRHQRRKLAVFCTPDPEMKFVHYYFDWPDNSDPDEGWSWGRRPFTLHDKYKQWNQEKKDWDRFQLVTNLGGSGWHWELVEDSDEPDNGIS